MKYFTRLLLLFFVWSMGSIELLSNTVEASDEASEIEKMITKRGEAYLRFQPADHHQLTSIGKVVSIDQYDPQSGYAYVYINERGLRSLLEFDLVLEPLIPPGLAVDKSSINMVSALDVENINSWDFYPTYEAYESMMEQFEELFPDLYERVEILTLESGRKIIFGRITANVDQEHDKPRFMYTSTMHGDEVAGFNLTLRLIHYLLNNYGEIDDITYLLDNMEIWICPNENPDGTYTSDNSTVLGATRSNSNFVDLNRNYPNPVMVPEPETQAETQAMIELTNLYPFVMSANMHSGIECVNYPWDSWTSNEKTHADHYWWQLVMHEYADTARFYSPSHYMNPSGSSFNNGVTHGGDWYVIYGSRQDYMNYYAHLREFTLELSDTKILPTDLLPDHWEYNHRSFLNYMKQSLYGIRGSVTDINTTEPVSAVVELMGHDEDNSYVYACWEHGGFNRPVLAGNYDVRVKAPGYPEKIIEGVEVNNYETTWLHVQVGVEVGTPTLSVETNRFIYPNPASQTISLMGLPQMERVMVFDSSGRMLMDQRFSSDEKLDITALNPGIYLVRIFARENVYNQKLIVE